MPGATPRSALITGSSSGIGRAVALRLVREGWTVFGGVRRAEDGERLSREARGAGELVPLALDVTEPKTIEAARESLAARLGTAGLGALVNNAGAAVAAPLELVPLDDLRGQLEVNLVGQIAVTQSMLPLLRSGRGRIVNMTSIGGLVVTPFYGPYCASKFGLEAVSDALRVELRPWSIETIAIEPGSVATDIWRRGAETFERIRGRLEPEGARLYGEAMDAAARAAAETGARGIEPERVAETVLRALTARRPRARYVVGRDARLMATAARLVPDRLYDRLVARAMRLP